MALLVAPVVGCSQPNESPAITLACAAVMRAPIEEISRQFQSERRVDVEVRFGGSNTLLTQLGISAGSDVYVAADSSYTRRAFDEGLIESAQPIATVVPVVVTRQGSGVEVVALEDLASGNLRIAIASPKTAAIGRNTKAVMESLGIWEALSLIHI